MLSAPTAVRGHSFNTGPLERYVQITCGTNCTHDLREVLLVDDPASATPFPATAEGPYKGCGPQAAANVGGYVLGRALSTEHVRSYTNTWGWGSNVGTTPDRLVDAIRKTLDLDLHHYNIVKHDHAYLPDIARRLLDGFPIVLLVNGGMHYQVVTGYRAPDQFFC